MLDLDVTTSVSGNAAFPSFGFNLYSDLPLFNYGNEDDAGADTAPTLTVVTGFSNKAEKADTQLTLTADSDARLTKGTQLSFGGKRVVVRKTVTVTAANTVVLVSVLDDKDGVAETVTISAGNTAALQTGAFSLAFNDITLDMGEFVTDLLGPIISSINDIVDPIRPVIEVMTSEVEILSKIGLGSFFDTDDDGKSTMIEVALTLAGGLKSPKTAAKFSKFVGAITGIIELTDSLADLNASIAGGDTLSINFGTYVLQNFKGASSSTDASTVDVGSAGNTSGMSSDATGQTKSSGNNKVGKFFGKLGDLGITLDVIENPLSVVQLMMGQDIDLITWDVPELDMGITIEKSFPLILGINGILRGGFNIHSDLVFGFDTYGFSQWKAEDFALNKSYLVFDGFYLSDVDPETGEDVDELTLDATLAAGVNVSAVIASVEAVGGIQGIAGLDLIDVGEYSGESDGRIRGSEIVSRISNPLQLFEIAGQVDAFLEMSVKVGVDLGFWSIMQTVYHKELARVTLFEFSVGGGGGGAAGSPLAGAPGSYDASLMAIQENSDGSAANALIAPAAPVSITYGLNEMPVDVLVAAPAAAPSISTDLAPEESPTELLAAPSPFAASIETGAFPPIVVSPISAVTVDEDAADSLSALAHALERQTNDALVEEEVSPADDSLSIWLDMDELLIDVLAESPVI